MEIPVDALERAVQDMRAVADYSVRCAEYGGHETKGDPPMSQNDVITNQKQILQNQKTILANQSAIKSNQDTIKKNQASILKNQAILHTIVANQKKILAKLK
jgi:hypothetical protein